MKKCDILIARSLRSLAGGGGGGGGFYAGVQGFQVRKDIITTTQMLAFLGIGEILMLDQKKIKLNFKKTRLKEMDLLTIMEFDFPEYDNKNLVNWRGRYEQSIIEGKNI